MEFLVLEARSLKGIPTIGKLFDLCRLRINKSPLELDWHSGDTIVPSFLRVLHVLFWFIWIWEEMPRVFKK